jgi:peptidoglycan/xylan/chitin deacetylase (PgdA/CDA1 family)
MTLYSSAILCYHAISEHWDDPLAVKPRAFEKQISRLLVDGWRPGAMDDALRGVRGLFHITFDDGFKSILIVYPFLRSLDIPITIFVCPYFDHDIIIPELEQAAEARPEEFGALTSEQLRTLSRDGVEIGSHGLYHRRLTELSDIELRREFEESRRLIEANIGRRCRYVAYPYGCFDERTKQAAIGAGFEAALTMLADPVQRTPMSAPRIGIYRKDDERRFRAKVALPIRLARQGVAVARRKRPDDPSPRKTMS